MNIEHRIHEYLDGTLSADRQSELFAMLAADVVAREELTSQIRLQTALRKDYAAIVVPADATAGIFSDLGLPVPGVPSVSTVSSGTASSSSAVTGSEATVSSATVTGTTSGWDYRRVLPLLLLLLSFAVVYKGRDIVDQLLNGSAVIQSTSEQPSQTSSQTSLTHQSQQQSSLPSTQQQSQQSAHQQLQQLSSDGIANQHDGLPMRSLSRRTADDYSRYSADGERDTQHNVPLPPKNDAATTIHRHDENVLLTAARTIQSSGIVRRRSTELTAMTPLSSLVTSTLPMVLHGDFELIARSATFRASNPEPNLVVGPITDQPWALGLHYRLSDDQVLGIDGGMERIPQEFTRVDFGVPTVYRQAPVIPWVGLTYRLDVNDARMFSSIVPSASVTAAWTQIGPMARAQALLRFTPESRMSIFLGVEGSLTAYPIQSTFFTTSTMQVTYGISYRF